MTCNRCDRKAMANLKHCKGCHAKLAEYRRRYERKNRHEMSFGRGISRPVGHMTPLDDKGYNLSGWRRDVQALASMLRTP